MTIPPWFDETDAGSCAFCRLTQMGFLRLATNPKAFGPEARTMHEAWELYDRLRSDERVEMLPEPAGVEEEWRADSSSCAFSPKVWNDAYLAAFAKAGGMQLVSFDQAFARYDWLDSRILA